LLDAYLFESVAEVQGLSDEWLRIYNERRPHEALGSVPPVHFRPRAVPGREPMTPVST
jgi:putative transposase